MANSNQPQESMLLMPFPLRGLEVTTEFSQQPPLTTSVAINVRGYEPTTGRDRGGQRSGLSRYLPQLATAGKIQHLNFIVDPQAEALIADVDNFGPLYLDYMDDPSTNNLVHGAAGPVVRNNNRRIRRGGSGRQSNRNRPSAGTKKNPVITWAAPADIWLGTALSAELSAQATDPNTALAVPGVFTYDPPAGTILGIHVPQPQELDVTFTPTDTAVYNTVGPMANNPGIIVRGIYAIVQPGTGLFTVDTGDLVVIGAAVTDSASGATVTVSDGANTYTQIGGYIRANSGGVFRSISLWYFIAGSPGSLTVTATPSGGSGSAVVTTRGEGHFRGALAFDATSNGSGVGAGESFSAGVCPVNFDEELVVTFPHYNAADLLTIKPQWPTGAPTAALYQNVRTAAAVSGGVAPVDGTSVSVDTVLSGTASNGPWCIISASFKHRIS